MANYNVATRYRSLSCKAGVVHTDLSVHTYLTATDVLSTHREDLDELRARGVNVTNRSGEIDAGDQDAVADRNSTIREHHLNEVTNKCTALASIRMTRASQSALRAWRIAGGIGVLSGAALLAHQVLAIDLGSGPGSHPETFVDVH